MSIVAARKRERSARSRAVLRTAGTRQDLARAYYRARTRGESARDLGPRDRAGGRSRRDRQRSRQGRRAVHRRDPSAGARGRGNPLSGDGGLRAEYRGRQGAGRALDEAGGQAVHDGRCDHPLGTAEFAAARSLRPAFPSGLLRRDELAEIVRRSARLLGIKIDDEGAEEIAARSRGTPRIANRLLRRVRDFAQVNEMPVGDPRGRTRRAGIARNRRLRLRPHGSRRFSPRLSTSSTAVRWASRASPRPSARKRDTIGEVYEPYLLQEGFVARTARGRVATQRAYTHLGRSRRGALL